LDWNRPPVPFFLPPDHQILFATQTMDQENRMTEKRVVRVKPNRYQPTKVELEESVKISATPEEVIRRAFQQVRVVQDRDA